MLLSLSSRKYPPFPLLSYFFMVVCLICLLHHILSLIAYTGKKGICFHHYCAVYDECRYSDTFWLADRTRLFCTVHHLINIIVRIYLKAMYLWNACQIYFVECMSKIKHILSVIHYTICRAVCFQFTHFCCDDWENIYTLSYYHHQIGSMNYYPLFRVRLWNNGVRCMSFYILMGSA